jgi:hypothetical protein
MRFKADDFLVEERRLDHLGPYLTEELVRCRVEGKRMAKGGLRPGNPYARAVEVADKLEAYGFWQLARD